ncbi:winged helix-turn-helix transcriptional regulator [Nocardia coubleae]|uniref:Helix-turn-helix transcriptional regulator n=1 Tax=Nocardia coubleae TaxID=356147 RepID=A0A846VYG8_9NOCA|nr:helix-turn-helix transcriptional regulator [Nocardia coubleae]
MERAAAVSGAPSASITSETSCPPIFSRLSWSSEPLTRRLEALVADGIVERRAYQQRPLRHEYHLTEAGRELVPVLMALMAWADKWATSSGGPSVRLVHDECGHQFTPQVCCSECAKPVTAQSVTALPGPGAASGPGPQCSPASTNCRRSLMGSSEPRKATRPNRSLTRLRVPPIGSQSASDVTMIISPNSRVSR